MSNFKATDARAFMALSVLDTAYNWFCRQRLDASPNNDIWHLRSDWEAERQTIFEDLQSGEYRFLPQHRIFACHDASDGDSNIYQSLSRLGYWGTTGCTVYCRR